ncbi:hypothetical protein Hamer_G012796 [Homarus americanus]|uniref:Uncharacterized protein n=2 Tax=Homarus americanus TaxID=6706 RepID=A0A8J5K4G0_HOMAM|nr:hypothetical protein Hamer_G012796 [Homarus americanus]
MLLWAALSVTLAGTPQVLATFGPTISVFELQLEAAVKELSFQEFSDIAKSNLLLSEEEEVVQRKMRKVLEGARMRETRATSEGNPSTDGGGGPRTPAQPDAPWSTELGTVQPMVDEEQRATDDNIAKRPKGVVGYSTRRHEIVRRSCPGGNGAYGFNTYNFLTFSLQVFNGVINAVNRINNNNNNNNDNSQNSVTVNTDQISSNSNSANAVLVIIPPSRRRKRHLSSCRPVDGNIVTLHTASALISLLQEYVDTLGGVNEACRGLHVCRSVRQVAINVGFQAIIWKSSPSTHLVMNSAPSQIIQYCRTQLSLYSSSSGRTMQTGRRMFLAVLVLVIVTRVNCEFDDDTLQKLRNILRKESRAFLDETAKVNQMREFNNLRKVTAVSSTPPSESSDSIKTNRTDKWSRWKRSGCPGGVGNFGFNSFNLLTFSLQAFNGVINTINNLNNNNNNNNINSGNNANSNFNEQNSNVNSMSMLVVIVPPPRRRKRELWEKENGHCEQDMSEQEIQTVIQDTYSTISDIIKMSQHNPNCGKYILCLNIQNSYARYGLQVLSEMSRQKKLWNDIIEPMLTAGHCSSLFPECFWA